MSKNKTQPTQISVEEFLQGISPESKQNDCRTICSIMEQITGEPPIMWGQMVGFGTYHYKYESGREGDWFTVGFAARKSNITLYIMAGFERYAELMAQLGKYKTGNSCLHINSLHDINTDTLKTLIKESVIFVRNTYPSV